MPFFAGPFFIFRPALPPPPMLTPPPPTITTTPLTLFPNARIPSPQVASTECNSSPLISPEVSRFSYIKHNWKRPRAFSTFQALLELWYALSVQFTKAAEEAKLIVKGI